MGVFGPVLSFGLGISLFQFLLLSSREQLSKLYYKLHYKHLKGQKNDISDGSGK